MPLLAGCGSVFINLADTYADGFVVGHTPTKPMLTALEQALTLQPAPRLVSHADRGSQYTN